MTDAPSTGLRVGLLLAVPAALAGIAGRPLLVPSLGPTAYALETRWRRERAPARAVLGSHLAGVLAGLAAYGAIGGGASVAVVHAVGSAAGVRLALSGVVSVALTAGAMRGLDAVHPPACATTLIVSLGLLATPLRAGLLLSGVVALWGAHRLTVAVSND